MASMAVRGPPDLNGDSTAQAKTTTQRKVSTPQPPAAAPPPGLTGLTFALHGGPFPRSHTPYKNKNDRKINAHARARARDEPRS